MAAALNQSVLDGMLAAFAVNEGVIKLVSADDDGRSLVCAALFEALRRQGTEVVYFLAPPQSVQALQDGIAEQLQLDPTRNFTRTLTHYLNSRDHAYRHLVLIVDQAHAMDEPTLMAVRMLCNIQSHAHELVRVVLSGSPALDTLLGLPLYRSLAQHIGQSFTLSTSPSVQPAATQEAEPQADTPSAGQVEQSGQPGTPDSSDARPPSRHLPQLGIVLGLGVLGVIAWAAWPQAPSSQLQTVVIPAAPALQAAAVPQMISAPQNQTAATPVPAIPAPVDAAVPALANTAPSASPDLATASAAPTVEITPPAPGSEPADTGTALPPELATTLDGWLTSWQRRALDDYLDYYAADFMPPQAQSRTQWQQQRVHNISSATGMALTYSDLSWSLPAPGRAMLRFWLHYRSNDYDDDTFKELLLVRQADGNWRIVNEINLEVKQLP